MMVRKVSYTDDLGLGYQPSVPTSKSRTGSMKYSFELFIEK